MKAEIQAYRNSEGFFGYLIEGPIKTTIRKDASAIFKSIETLVATASVMRPGQHFWIGDVKVEDLRPSEVQLRIRKLRWTAVVCIYLYALFGSIFKWWPFQ